MSRKKPRVRASWFLALLIVGLLGQGGDSGLQTQETLVLEQVPYRYDVADILDVCRLRQADGCSTGEGKAAVGGVLDATPTPLPSQRHTPTAAAEDTSGDSRMRAGTSGAVVESVTVVYLGVEGEVVSYTALGEIVAAYDWPLNEAFAVVDCESGWTPDAVSWDGSSYGLFQVNSIHSWRWPSFWDTWYNAVDNTRYAYELWLEQGWAPWSCAPY